MQYFTNEKHYNTLNNYYRARFGTKVMKIALNGGFSCPNRDGTLSTKGCLFCSEKGSGDFAGNPVESIKNQYKQVKTMMNKKWKDGLYIAYFQAFSNTYGPIEQLKTIYETALSLDNDIIGLNIGTRADCFNDDIYDLLDSLNHQTYLTVELGLQSMHDESLAYINRGHNRDQFTKTVRALRQRGIDVVVHIINGLPGETKEMMFQTIDYINQLDIQGIKIHMLYVIKNTPLASIYLNDPFDILSLAEYTDITVHQIRKLNPNIIIHRVTGDPPKNLLITPEWTLKKFVVQNNIDKQMRKQGFYQGDLYHPLFK